MGLMVVGALIFVFAYYMGKAAERRTINKDLPGMLRRAAIEIDTIANRKAVEREHSV